MSSVGIFSCQFNGWYQGFLPGWFEACLATGADRIVLVSDRYQDVPRGVKLHVVDPPSKVGAPFFLNQAVQVLGTDWCWNMDIDDLICSDSVDQMRFVDADVWCAGMRTTEGSVYIPRGMSAERILESDRNYMNAGSAFRREVFEEAGGYPNVRLYDWGLWRRLARIGASFVCSGRVDYLYRMGHESLSFRAETPEDRAEVLAL